MEVCGTFRRQNLEMSLWQLYLFLTPTCSLLSSLLVVNCLCYMLLPWQSEMLHPCLPSRNWLTLLKLWWNESFFPWVVPNRCCGHSNTYVDNIPIYNGISTTKWIAQWSQQDYAQSSSGSVRHPKVSVEWKCGCHSLTCQVLSPISSPQRPSWQHESMIAVYCV